MKSTERLERIVSNLKLASTLAEAILRREQEGAHHYPMPMSTLVMLGVEAANISDALLVAEQSSRSHLKPTANQNDK